jgi:lipooligosaccharide transport system ATP-binding protein
MLTTHYMEEAFQLCDDVLIVESGKAVLRGNPKALVESSIEPYVLELTDSKLAPQVLAKVDRGQVRVEQSDESVRVYGGAYESLRSVADGLPPGDYHLRPSTLEDVFLKATGRSLDARQ